jgi:hypothetical protein
VYFEYPVVFVVEFWSETNSPGKLSDPDIFVIIFFTLTNAACVALAVAFEAMLKILFASFVGEPIVAAMT